MSLLEKRAKQNIDGNVEYNKIPFHTSQGAKSGRKEVEIELKSQENRNSKQKEK